MSKKIRTPNYWKIIFCIFLSAILVLGMIFIYNHGIKKPSAYADPYVTEISKFMVLPEEIPILTTIDDVAKFKERHPLFLKSAKSGDVLISFRYWTILYDLKAKKILNMASVFHLAQPQPLIPLRISLRYSGKEQDRIKAIKTQLEGISINYQIVESVDSNIDYQEDVVYLVNPKREEDAIFLAQILGNSPFFKKLEKEELVSSNIDVIIAFRKIP